MDASGRVRWGIVGTANIARAQFLPALREAGGVAAAVAGRDAARTQQYARDSEIERAITGYASLIADPAVDALYIALPNALHAEWTIRALEAGKPVLCEKPLCGRLDDTESVLAVAEETGTLLWEAFVFPFQPQMQEIRKLLADGAVGELMEIKSNFHFLLRNPANIRLSSELEGGALLDVGCYPVRIAQELFGPATRPRGRTPSWAATVSTWTPGGCSTTPGAAGSCSRAAWAAATTPSPRSRAPPARSASLTRSTPVGRTRISW
jgi:predicted dehydrogenase